MLSRRHPCWHPNSLVQRLSSGSPLSSALQLFAFFVQTSPFVFNSFQDAPPATLSFSWFCIVAGGRGGGRTLKCGSCIPHPSSGPSNLQTFQHPSAPLSALACAVEHPTK